MNTKTILITGCSSGIGYAVAKGLHDRGYRVFASARNDEDVARLQEEGLEAMQLDVDNPVSIQTALDEILNKTGGELYALFNNGAYGQPGAIEDLRRDVLLDQFETNVFGWHDLICRILPVMRKQGYGRIIQNSSVLGLVCLPYRGAYNASKYAIEGLSDTLRLELAGTNIHVSIVEPGPIVSRFRANAHKMFKQNIDVDNSPHKERYQSTINRLSKPEGDEAPFTLGPNAVLKKVLHALESPKPKVRYYVTFPTYLFATLKRVLPHSWMDKFMLFVDSGDNKKYAK